MAEQKSFKERVKEEAIAKYISKIQSLLSERLIGLVFSSSLELFSNDFISDGREQPAAQERETL